MMFDFSLAEIALAGLAAIVAVKPDDMPGFLRGCGQKMRDFGRWRRQWSSEMQTMLDPDAPEAYKPPRREMFTPEGSDESFERYASEGDISDYDDTGEDELYAEELEEAERVLNADEQQAEDDSEDTAAESKSVIP